MASDSNEPTQQTNPAGTQQPQPETSPPARAAPPSKPPKQLSNTALVVIGCGVVLALFALQVWSSGNTVRNVRRKGVVRCTESLAASFRQYLLDRNPDRTRRALVDVAEAGKFEEVTLTDRAGNVLASTDRTKESRSIYLPSKAPIEPHLSFANGRITVLKAVVVGGDNVLGNLRIVARDGE